MDNNNCVILPIEIFIILFMFVIRSPFRIPLAGGGTDIPAFYKKNDGFLISTTINKYIYLTFNKTFNTNEIILKYSKIES